MQEREGAGQVGCRIGGMQNTLIEKIGKIDFNEYSLMGWSESTYFSSLMWDKMVYFCENQIKSNL